VFVHILPKTVFIPSFVRSDGYILIYSVVITIVLYLWTIQIIIFFSTVFFLYTLVSLTISFSLNNNIQ